jgi:hypothetical protein
MSVEPTPREPKPEIPTLTLLAGFLIGMQVDPARKIGTSARADLEPSIGPFAGTVVEWLISFIWILLIAWFVTWFIKRSWVRAIFENAEAYRRKRDV